jgi:ABC-type uncharacterized transport system permease subunit
MDRSDHDASFWSRLPKRARHELAYRNAVAERRETANTRDVLAFRFKYTVFGAVAGSVINFAQGEQTIEFRLVLVLVCGLAAYFLASRRKSLLTGVIVYGGAAVGASIAAMKSGSSTFHLEQEFHTSLGVAITLFAWLFFLVAGGLLALLAGLEHDRRLT